MIRRWVSFWAVVLATAATMAWTASAQQDAAPPAAPSGPPRIGFVVGNANYPTAPLPTALADAGLVAEALRSVGFEIVEGADLTQADLVRSFREYLGKLEQAGPDAVGFMYFAGYGFAFEGDNYLAGVDAKLERDSDVPLDAVRLSDLLRSLGGAPARSKIVVVDAARKLPFRLAEQGLAPGLAAVEAPPGMLIGFSAAPGLVAPDQAGQGAYGAYATAIAEMVRAAGLDMPDVFTRIRARTHEITAGRQTPWHVSALTEPLVLVPADAVTDAPAPVMPAASRGDRPFRELSDEEAYAIAIERDRLPVYVEFVEAFPNSPYAKRVWVIIRARREALAWQRAVEMNTPQSYWTYLRRYPNGIYARDAERRLGRLAAPVAPPQAFAPVEFADVPPPLPDEPPTYFYDDYPPAPPPPPVLIAPRPRYWVDLPPPPPPIYYGGLPPVSVMPVIPRVRPGVRIPVVLPGRPLPPNLPPNVRPGYPIGPGVRPGGPGPGTLGPGTPGPGTPVLPGAPGVRPGTPGVPMAPIGPGVRPGGPGVPMAPVGPGVRPGVRPGGPPPQGLVGVPPGGPPPGPSVGGTPPGGVPPGGPGVRPGRPGGPVMPGAPGVRPGGPPPQGVVGVPPGGLPAGEPGVRPGRPGPGGLPPPGPGVRPGGPPPPTVVNRPPPPTVVNRPPPPPAVHRAPPPMVRPSPPPPVHRPPPPVVSRPAPPPVVHRPPPPMVRPAPPPPPMARPAAPPPPRPTMAAPPPRPAAPPPPPRRCVVVNGQQVCR